MPVRKLYYFLCCLLILQACSEEEKEDLATRIMSFNIRMDTRNDGKNRWTYRRDYACEMIRYHRPDLIGTQEVLHQQLLDMQQRLPEYATVGVGREDGKEKGEYNAVFYRKDRYELLAQHTFWLSEDPEAIGKKGWDAACERVVTWVKLKDKKLEKTFYFFNTHFDHRGTVARRESCALLKTRVKEIAGSDAAFITGDFNAEPQSEVILALTDPADPDHLTDTRQLAGLRCGPEYTYHDYGRLEPARLEIIDYIFVKNIQAVKQLAVLTDQKDGLYVSDHYPVLAVIEL